MRFADQQFKYLAILLFVFPLMRVEGAPGRVYWAQVFDDQICQVEATGASRQVLLQFPNTNEVVDVAADPSTGQVFWAQAFEDRIQRANLDGSNTSVIVEFPVSNGIIAMALDHLAQKVYWAQSFDDRIMRANFSGADVEILLQFPEVFDVVDLELDPVRQKLYWAESQDDTIRRSNLDGSGVEDIVSFPSASGVVGLAVGPAGRFLYWAQTFSDRIKRINLSDALVETIVENPISTGIADIAIDPSAGNLYWIQSVDDTLHRTDLVGSSPVTIASWPDVDGPIALTTDALPPSDVSSGQSTTRASVRTDGTEGNGQSSRVSLAADGRYAAFYSDATNLVDNDLNGVRDIFVFDRLTGETRRVSVNSSAIEGNAKSDRPAISADGRFVVFTSDATNLAGTDTNAQRDIFVHDRDVDTNGIFDEAGAVSTTRVSLSSAGVEANGRCNMPAISANGRHVAFRSVATNLVAAGTNGVDHIFVHDRQNGTTVLASTDSAGLEGNAGSDRPAVSDDGRFVAFHSDADNLVAGDSPTFDAALCPLCTGVRDVFLRDRDPDANGVLDEGNSVTTRVSLSSADVPGDGASSRPTISADGRFVEYRSLATNLVNGDTNAVEDIFVRDRQSGTTVRVSLSSAGDQGEGAGPDSGRASVSDDGRYVAFKSDADGLVADDTNLVTDIFVRDRLNGTTVRVSVDSNGVEGNLRSNRPSISADGRFVAFYSDAYNLVAGDDPPFDAVLCPACVGVRDIFVHDRDPDMNGVFDEGNGTTERVSVDSLGTAANSNCTRPSISADGRHVAFRSTADNLVSNDTNGLQDIFVHDRSTGTTVRVSVDSVGAQTTDGNSDLPSISGDGRLVAFWSKASTLVSGDDPPFDDILCPSCIGLPDIFVHDRDPDANGTFDEGNGVTVRVSVSSGGAAGNARSDRPWMAADGRYVGFISEATNLVTGDANAHSDVFVHDLQTGTTMIASVSSSGAQGNFGSDRISLSADGRFVAFRSKADDLVAGDTPSFDADTCPLCTGNRDVFVHDRDPDMNGTFDEGNGTTTRVSVSTAGDPGNLESGGPKISGDGSLVAFVGPASNLVADDTNHAEDVFAHEQTSGMTTRLSVNSAEEEAATPLTIIPGSDEGSISASGRFVVFRSTSVNLVARDRNGVTDIFIHDRDVDDDGIFDEAGFIETRRVSVSSTGLEGDLGSSRPSVSADGLQVAFQSDARNLVAADSNLVRDIFIGSFSDCAADADCDNPNECTAATCNLSTGLCEFTPLAEGTACGNQTPDSECDEPDACDDAGACDPNPSPAGTACTSDGNDCTDDACDGLGICNHPPVAQGTLCDDQNACTENDACDQGVCSGDAIPDCGGCVLDSDCDDGAACTLDECISDECVYQDLCADNGIFCDGAESCDVQAGVCMSAGDPCPGSCSEIGGCPCGTPAAESVGPRYIGVMPLPADSSTPMKLLVESAELPCLSKFVGSLACGGKGDVCSSDADCNACTGTNAPCLTDFDCRTCSDQPTIPCTTDSDCNVDATCMTIQMCQVSELLCLSTGAPTPIDIDDDGVFDGTLAVLVDDPADALSLTPSEWVGGFTAHCNLSMGSCVSDADCDAGKCALPDGRASSTSCSVASQDCAGGETCLLVEICLEPAVYLHGVDIIPSESDTTGTDPVFVPQTYDVSAQCGGAPTAATTLEMRLWGDVAENNKLVNVTDISFILLGFQGRWDAARGLTKVGVDLVTTGGPCFTDPESINATDLLRALRAFQRKTYASEVISSTAATGCLLPCP